MIQRNLWQLNLWCEVWRLSITRFGVIFEDKFWLIRAYAWRRYFCRRLARDLKVLKILFCTRLYGFVPSSISSGSVRSYNRSQLKSVRKQVTIYIIRYWNGKQFSTYNLFSINPWNPTSTTEQRNVSVKEVKLVLLNSCHLMSHDLIFPASLSRGDNWQYGNFRTLFARNANHSAPVRKLGLINYT